MKIINSKIPFVYYYLGYCMHTRYYVLRVRYHREVAYHNNKKNIVLVCAESTSYLMCAESTSNLIREASVVYGATSCT